jgi:hypothetical protein
MGRCTKYKESNALLTAQFSLFRKKSRIKFNFYTVKNKMSPLQTPHAPKVFYGRNSYYFGWTTKQMNTLCGESSEVLNVTAGVTYIYIYIYLFIYIYISLLDLRIRFWSNFLWIYNNLILILTFSENRFNSLIFFLKKGNRHWLT